jgi:2-polyprenyl-3-methyl-5-hydroxy-6-metoxy-1,4-benzoquinol methylase
MGRMSLPGTDERIGRGIYAFLEHYVLVMLDEAQATPQQMIATIRERSAGNDDYRDGSALEISPRQMDCVLCRLQRESCVRTAREPDLYRVTTKGKRQLERAEGLKQQTGVDKDEAADKLISLLGPPPPPKKVLDVGTGGGYLALNLAEAGFEVTAIDSEEFDYSKDSIKRAMEAARERQCTVEFRRTNVARLRRRDAFDYVVASQAVHCMRDQPACLRAIHRLLKPAGKFVCLDFNVGLVSFLHHGFHSFLALTTEEWRRQLSQCGFERVRIHDLDDFCIVQASKPA